MRPIFKTEMLIYPSEANLEVKTLLGKIIHLLDLGPVYTRSDPNGSVPKV